jgi:hypothetical protein
MNSQARTRRFQFTLRALFVVITAICIYLAFPQFFTGMLALLLGVIIAGTLLTLLVFRPIQKLAGHITGDQPADSPPDPTPKTY